MRGRFCYLLNCQTIVTKPKIWGEKQGRRSLQNVNCANVSLSYLYKGDFMYGFSESC